MIGYREENDRFGISPFAVGLAHPDTTLETQLAIQIALNQVTNEEVRRLVGPLISR